MGVLGPRGMVPTRQAGLVVQPSCSAGGQPVGLPSSLGSVCVLLTSGNPIATRYSNRTETNMGRQARSFPVEASALYMGWSMRYHRGGGWGGAQPQAAQTPGQGCTRKCKWDTAGTPVKTQSETPLTSGKGRSLAVCWAQSGSPRGRKPIAPTKPACGREGSPTTGLHQGSHQPCHSYVIRSFV